MSEEVQDNERPDAMGDVDKGKTNAEKVDNLLPRTPSQNEKFYDLYPERLNKKQEYSMLETLLGKDRDHHYKRICEEYVVESITKYPLVKILIGALESQGCAINLERHIKCDICNINSSTKMSKLNQGGNYDDREKQVIICANKATSFGYVHGALVRNLIHLFDDCVNKVDFRNVDHLACMEVRKANLANCNLMVSKTRSDANFSLKNQHRHCVRSTAIQSLTETKFVEPEMAEKAVDRVFERCYRDTEPIGRLSYSTCDMKRAFEERYLYGYH